MISMRDIHQILRTIWTKLFFIVGRCILDKVRNEAGDTQRVDITCMGETLTKRERIQEYGFDTSPPVDDSAEGVALFINGNRDQGIVIKIGNRKYRPTDLNENEVCMYCKDSNDSNQNRITIKPDNTIEVKTADGNLFTIDSNGIIITDKNNNKVTMNSTGMKLEDKNNNVVDMGATSVKINNNLEVLQ